MTSLLDSSGLRLGGYVAAALAAAFIGHRERQAAPTDRWWVFWFMCAAVLLTLGVGRAADLGDTVADLGRDRARLGGWYAQRRAIQILATAALAAGWVAGAIALVRRPGSRRHIPPLVVLSMLVGFAATRMVSLHTVDTVLYRRDLAGVRVVSVIELGLLVAMVTVTLRPGPTNPR